MNYQEFKSSYKWTLKHYPGADSLCNYSELIRLETVTYERPRRGSRWIETGRTMELVTNEFYMNSIDAVPFFRALGGSERVEMNYTREGYLPTFISSINPDGTKKTTRRFIFAFDYDLINYLETEDTKTAEGIVAAGLFDEAENLMDDEIREDLHAKMAPCTKVDFLKAYMEEHEKKFGVPFVID